MLAVCQFLGDVLLPKGEKGMPLTTLVLDSGEFSCAGSAHFAGEAEPETARDGEPTGEWIRCTDCTFCGEEGCMAEVGDVHWWESWRDSSARSSRIK